jgi:hypothetical protein
MLGGVALVLALAWPAHAEPQPYAATVQVPSAEVRSGPSTQFYVTSVLRQGEVVTVVGEEEPGWLAIKPPPDSFSWISTKDVDQQGQLAHVKVEGASIFVGSRHINAEPSVSRIKVAAGTLLTVIGMPMKASNGIMLLPISPVAPKEVRYLPANAVAPPAVAKQPAPATVVPNTYTQPQQPQVAARPPNLLEQAEAAERAGKRDEAAQLYQQAADQLKATHYDLALYCLNRVDYLRNPRPAAMQQPPVQQALASYGNPPAQQPWGASQYPSTTAATSAVRLQPPDTSNSVANGGACFQTLEPGRLERAGCKMEDDKRVFRLVPLSNNVFTYVIEAPNVDLMPYLNRVVVLTGQLNYHPIMKKNLMVAAQVNPLP